MKQFFGTTGWNIKNRFSPASPRLLQSFSVQLFHFPHYYIHGEKKKERRESEFDQKHNFRDVISGRACANRFRCFSIYRGNTCGDVAFFFVFSVSFFFASFLHHENYIAKRHATLSRRYGIVCCEFRVRLFARATTVADIYPSTPTC